MIEQAPAWSEGTDRGVIAEGPVGARMLGRFRVFRYEVRRWRDGVKPDIAEAVGSPLRLSDEPRLAQRLLEIVPEVPTPVWGRDELGAGEMGNSNSTISWLLARSGLDAESIPLPRGGRAPGWEAGTREATPPCSGGERGSSRSRCRSARFRTSPRRAAGKTSSSAHSRSSWQRCAVWSRERPLKRRADGPMPPQSSSSPS